MILFWEGERIVIEQLKKQVEELKQQMADVAALIDRELAEATVDMAAAMIQDRYDRIQRQLLDVIGEAQYEAVAAMGRLHDGVEDAIDGKAADAAKAKVTQLKGNAAFTIGAESITK